MEFCPKSGKRCFKSEHHARRGMRRMGASLRTYRCQDCGHVHLTKKNAR